jgi:shikimate kinase
MKRIIIVIGNMASGKSSLAKALAARLRDYDYICQDDFRNSETAKYMEVDNRLFEEEVATNTIAAMHRSRQFIYESTGATRFFRDRYYEFLKAGYEMFVIRLICPIEICITRFYKRREQGKNHLVPMFYVSKSPEEIIEQFEKKAAWVKADLKLDSYKLSVPQLLEKVLDQLNQNGPVEEAQEILKNWNYHLALAWFHQNIEGKSFLKTLLSKKEDAYNTLKLKKELNDFLHASQVEKEKSTHRLIPSSERLQPPTQRLTPKVATFVKKKSKIKIDELLDEIESSKEDAIQELEDKLDELKQQLAQPTPELQLADEDNLDEKWKPIYKEANYYFSTIHLIPDEEERKLAAFRILDLMDKVQEVWQAKDFLYKHGQVPKFESQGIDQLTVEQMARRINTLRTYISKAHKGKLNAERIPDWEAEMQELQRKIKG